MNHPPQIPQATPDQDKPRIEFKHEGGNTAIRFRQVKSLVLSGFESCWGFSQDLQTWTRIETPSTTETEEETTTVELLTIPSNDKRTFLRLRVSELPSL